MSTTLVPANVRAVGIRAKAAARDNIAVLPAPAPNQCIKISGHLDQSWTGGGMERLKGMAHHVRGEDPTFLHQNCGTCQCTLSAFVIDQRQPARRRRRHMPAAA